MSGNGRLTRSTTRKNIGINMAYGCTIDTNTYCYRLIDGKQVFSRVKLGRGWAEQPFDVTKLSCYEEKKGEDNVVKGRIAKEKPSDEELRIFAEKHNQSNLVKRVKNEYHVGEPTARRWLKSAGLIKPRQAKEVEDKKDYGQCVNCGYEFVKGDPVYAYPEGIICWACELEKQKAQTPPEPDQAENQEQIEPEPIHCGTCKHKQGDCTVYCLMENQYTNYEPQTPEMEGDQPDPAQEAQEPANNSISEKEITVKDVLMYELEQKEVQYTPTDNDYSDEPQRTTLTRAQYDAMAMNDDRMSALAIFCENQAVEQLRQDWAVSVFKHSRLSRERKLELIGQLLDWRAGA